MPRNFVDHDTKMRISILRAIMIFGIVVLHTPAYVPIAEIGSGWFDLTKAFFQSAVFRCAVPMLTCISGYLLFQSGPDTDFKKLAVKKCRTLLIPFLTCNVLLSALLYVLQSHYPLQTSYQLYPFDSATMFDAAFSLTKAPVNYPLHFIRDLFILMMLSPLFGWLLKHSPLQGLLLVALIFWFNMDGYFIQRNEMAIMFYVGGMAAVQKWNLRRLDDHAGACLVLFLALCSLVVIFQISNTTFLRFLAPVLIWPATALISNTNAGSWIARRSKYSFFVFLLHAPLLLVWYTAYKKFVPEGFYPLYWFVTPVLVTWLLVTIYKICIAVSAANFGLFFGLSTTKANSSSVQAMPGVAAPVHSD